MSGENRAGEATQVTLAFDLALAKIGAATIDHLLSLWHGVQPGASPEAVDRWHGEAIQVVLSYRDTARDLAVAYYRLLRALNAGATVPPLGQEPSGNVTLGDLRREYTDALRKADSLYAGPPTTAAEMQQPGDVPVVRARDDYDYRNYTEGSGDAIKEEPLHMGDALDKHEQETLAEIEDNLATLGPDNLDAKLSKIDTSRPAKEVDAARLDAHDEAGARHAAAGERLAMNGARDTTIFMLNADRRSLGWCRVSTTGTPCGWCAMLISRGAVYKSEGTAAKAYDDGMAFHDNDHCIAVPVFSREELNTSDTFRLNREYAQLWPKVTRGYGGAQAITVWRRYFRAQARSQGSPTNSPGG